MSHYEFHTDAPTLEDYLALRKESGLTPKRPDQGEPALANTWAWCRAVLAGGSDDDGDSGGSGTSGRSVAMGRVIGDGGWYFLIADMATLPEHQRNGLGRHILDTLVEQIRTRAPQGAYITLLADLPGQRLYEQVGFTRPDNGSVTMHLLLE